MSGNRAIIGSEIDDTKHVELDRLGTKIAVPVSIYDASGNQISLASGLVPNSYNSITLSYDASGNIITAVYKLGASTVATLTLTYNSSNQLLTVTKT